MTMDVRQLRRYRLADDYNIERGVMKRPYHHSRRQKQAMVRNQSLEHRSVDERSETKTKCSPTRSPRFVKSLVSGRINCREHPTAANDNNSSSPDNNSREHIVINKILQQKTKPNVQNLVAPKPETKTAFSFLSSIGACAGVGRIAASFHNEHNEEIQFSYRLTDCHASSARRDLRDQDNEEEMNNYISRLSDTPTLSRARTCTTSNTTVSNSMISNTRDNTVTVESIGTGDSSSKGVTLNSNYLSPKQTFSTERQLLYGTASGNGDLNGDETTTISSPTRTKESSSSSSIFCSKSRKILCNKKNNPCLDSNEIVPRQWCKNPSPTSPTSTMSLTRSCSPDRTLYTAAYGDDYDVQIHSEDIGCLSEEFIGCDNGETETGQSLLFQIADSGTSHTSSVDPTHEVQYWRQRLHYATEHYGKTHSSTADAYFNLGRAQLSLNEGNADDTSDAFLRDGPKYKNAVRKKHRYDMAIENLTIAKGIWERTHGPGHLAVGRALDSLALAIVRRANHDRSESRRSNRGNGDSQSSAAIDDLRYAQRLLEQAFGIRTHHLGVWHVDTVETFNKLAGVLLHLGRYRDASMAYREVFLVRRAIFGDHHPSVAIAAHSLANCHYKMGAIRESLEWYKVSLDIYETMGLSYRHPAIASLLRDQSRLEKYM